MNIYESTKNPFELMYLFNPQPKHPSERENIIKLYGFSNKFSLAFHVPTQPKNVEWRFEIYDYCHGQQESSSHLAAAQFAH